MSILLEALEILAESQSFASIYNEILDAIKNSEVGLEDGGRPTHAWLAGLLASRGAGEGKIAQLVTSLERGVLEPGSKEYRDAVRTKAALSVLHRYGLVNRDGDGRFTFPSSQPKDARKREILSAFRDFLSRGLNTNKEQRDLANTFRNAKEEAAKEWENSLPADKRRLLDAYKEMTTSAFTLLRSLFHAKGPEAVAEFRKRLGSAKFSDSIDLELLKKHGFVGQHNLLNRGMVKKFGEFLRDPDGTGAPNAFARLMPFNPELTFFIKRSTADKALARNAAEKTAREASVDNLDDTPQTKDELGQEETRALYSRISDRDGGTKLYSRNERAKDQKSNFIDMVNKAFAS